MDLNVKVAKRRQPKDVRRASKSGIALENVSLQIGKFINQIALFFNNNKKIKNKMKHKKKEEVFQKFNKMLLKAKIKIKPK